MIVQTAPPGEPRFVIRQQDHARAAGRLAAAFGNEASSPLEPEELLLFVTAHHDEGWQPVDDALILDGRSGLPYNLSETPLEEQLLTNTGSPDFNERHHPLCGILSSMHTCGLYNGRYGIVERRKVDTVSGNRRPPVEAMLEAEFRRQAQLRSRLREDPRTAPWAEERFLLFNYKRLQFFDLLSLYFHRVHPEQRTQAAFTQVPLRVGEEAAITIRPQEDGSYQLDPFPFAGSELEFATEGRRLTPQPSAQALHEAFAQAQLETQTCRLTRERRP